MGPKSGLRGELAERARRRPHPLEVRPVEAEAPAGGQDEQPGLAQDLQVLRDARRGEADVGHELARRTLALRAERDEPAPDGMRERAQELVEVLLGGQVSAG
jgi:hypothetical protein